MEPTRRITPEEVLSAYKATGIEPRRFDCGACALACIMVVEGITSDGFSQSRAWTTREKKWMDGQFGRAYRVGFMNGFDGVHIPSGYDSKCAEQGYADGVSCAAAVFQPARDSRGGG